MAAKIFGLEPSRTLNQSESVALGCAIFGALEHKLLNMSYFLEPIAARPLSARWGQDRKRELFLCSTRLPSTQILNFGNEGTVDLWVFSDAQSLTAKAVARVRFRTPNKVSFTLDSNKVLTVQAQEGLELCDLGHKEEAVWERIRAREEEMRKIDSCMSRIYELKNEYESRYYWCKNKFEEVKAAASAEEQHRIR
jgi:molecular chaperone DnaK (HSP70)